MEWRRASARPCAQRTPETARCWRAGAGRRPPPRRTTTAAAPAPPDLALHRPRRRRTRANAPMRQAPRRLTHGQWSRAPNLKPLAAATGAEQTPAATEDRPRHPNQGFSSGFAPRCVDRLAYAAADRRSQRNAAVRFELADLEQDLIAQLAGGEAWVRSARTCSVAMVRYLGRLPPLPITPKSAAPNGMIDSPSGLLPECERRDQGGCAPRPSATVPAWA